MEHDELELYPDDIASKNEKVPKHLKFLYLILPFWGLLWWFFFWNGSYGWLDRGYWFELQKAANTTMPFHNADSSNHDNKN